MGTMKKYKEIYEDIKLLQDKAKDADYKASEIIGKPYGNGDFLRFDEKGAIFSYEYNNSCHCHPEYVTESYLIPFEWIDAIVTKYVIPPEQNIIEPILEAEYNESLDYTQLTALLHAHKAKIEEDKVKEEERRKRIQEDDEKKVREEREKKEREEFERLSKKYSNAS
jgi:hypothetical protein